MIREMNDIDRGGLRLLTLGEINLARTLYAFTIRYNEVWIHRSSYLPFNLQKNNYAMTPNGELYFQEGTYEPDFSQPHVNFRLICLLYIVYISKPCRILRPFHYI